MRRKVFRERDSPFAAVCRKFFQAFFLTGSKSGVNRFSTIQARSSGGERYLDTVEVMGSNPFVPTMIRKGLQRLKVVSPFLMEIF
jgi:hypothetical protein